MDSIYFLLHLPHFLLFRMRSAWSERENKCNKLFLQGFSCYKITNKSDSSGWALLYMLVGRKNETDALTHAIRKRVYFNSSFWLSFSFFVFLFFCFKEKTHLNGPISLSHATHKERERRMWYDCLNPSFLYCKLPFLDQIYYN